MNIWVNEWKSLSHVWLFAIPWTTEYGILQARILEWVAFPFFRGSFQPRDRTQVSHIAGRFFYQLSRSSVQFSCSVVSDSLQPHGLQHARPCCPSPAPRVYSNHVHWVSDAIQLSHPLLSPFLLPSIFRSIRVFTNESVLHIRWPKYWSFSLSISPSNEYSGLISFRISWFIFLQSKGLSSVFSNTTIQKHQFFSAQLSLWSNSHIHTWLLQKL